MAKQTAGRLILMRHAKSSHDAGCPSDHARPLAPRGRRDTPAMAKWLVEQDCVPERILCSDSTRTRETAELLLQAWQASAEAGLSEAEARLPEIEYRSELYHADPHDIVESLRRFHEGRVRLMVIAHNPGISEFATLLCGQPISMATAAVAVFAFPELAHSEDAAMSREDAAMSPLESLSLRSRLPLDRFATPKSLGEAS